jgi:hypothetical protein
VPHTGTEAEGDGIQMGASQLKSVSSAAETILRRQISGQDPGPLASTRATMPRVCNPPYLTYGYGSLACTMYPAEGATVALRLVDLVRRTRSRGAVNR